jgi:PhzF family phenazine biosynthesis protein
MEVVTVFADGPGGGNPAPVILDAAGWSDEQMQDVARRSGRESAFVLPAADGCDFALRFWVPRHEMTMCGHATVGTTWLLAELGRLPGGRATVNTRSGIVRSRVVPGGAEVSQPAGHVTRLAEPEARAVTDALGLPPAALAGRPVNAATSRVKTLVPLADAAVLDAIEPRAEAIEAVCRRINSTGLYPYVVVGTDPVTVDARQFPSGAGYPEDPATGVAAAALAYGLLADGTLRADGPPLVVRQGRAMGRPSRLTVRLEDDGSGCWVGGPVVREPAVPR